MISLDCSYVCFILLPRYYQLFTTNESVHVSDPKHIPFDEGVIYHACASQYESAHHYYYKAQKCR